MCIMHIIWREARDCWLAIAENRACNTAKEGVLSDQFASFFQLSRDYSKFLVLCLGYACFSACREKQKVLTLLYVAVGGCFLMSAALIS